MPDLTFPELSYGLIFLCLSAALFAWAASDALLTNAEPRGALAWLFVCGALPVVGPFLYYLFGKNRIRTRARRLKPDVASIAAEHIVQSELKASHEVSAEAALHSGLKHYESLLATGRALSADALLDGNKVTPLLCCERAYSDMLRALATAEKSIFLSSYIFDHKGVGRQFIDALEQAHKRDVDIRVLIDGIGSWYHWGRTARLLKKRGIRVAKFLPPRLIPLNVTLNLRNHRKILVVDQRIAFVGGMNILAAVPPVDASLLDKPCEEPLVGVEQSVDVDSHSAKQIRDIHFRVEGPAVRSIESVFADDWLFATRKALPFSGVIPASAGDMLCRVICDGPNRDIDKLTRLLLAAIGSARHQIRIMSPYFLPPKSIELALQTAAMRGVDVRLYLPQRNNFHVMDWAMRHVVPHYLRKGVKVYMQDGGFIHSKLFMVDDIYSIIGSSNMDARSLRLNFELVLESYSTELNQHLLGFFEQSERGAQSLKVDDMQYSLLARLRNSLCWLFSPYL